jgi:hypothetical protein
MSAFDRAQAMYDAAEPDEIEEGAMSDPMTDTHDLAGRMSNVLTEIGFMDTEDRRNLGIDGAELFYDATIRSYGEAGVMTRDAGFVLSLPDGTEYQITVVQSR